MPDVACMSYRTPESQRLLLNWADAKLFLKATANQRTSNRIENSHFRRHIFLVLCVLRGIIELDTHIISGYHTVVDLYTLATFWLTSLWLNHMAGIPDVAQSCICHTLEHNVLNLMGLTPENGFCGRLFVCIKYLAFIYFTCYVIRLFFTRPFGRMVCEEATEFWHNLSFY